MRLTLVFTVSNATLQKSRFLIDYRASG